MEDSGRDTSAGAGGKEDKDDEEWQAEGMVRSFGGSKRASGGRAGRQGQRSEAPNIP